MGASGLGQGFVESDRAPGWGSWGGDSWGAQEVVGLGKGRAIRPDSPVWGRDA